jgi:hypothetical protein
MSTEVIISRTSSLLRSGMREFTRAHR